MEIHFGGDRLPLVRQSVGHFFRFSLGFAFVGPKLSFCVNVVEKKKKILNKYVGQMFSHVHFTHNVTSIETCWDICISFKLHSTISLLTAPCQLESVEPRKRFLCTYRVYRKYIRKASITPRSWSLSCLCF